MKEEFPQEHKLSIYLVRGFQMLLAGAHTKKNILELKHKLYKVMKAMP